METIQGTWHLIKCKQQKFDQRIFLMKKATLHTNRTNLTRHSISLVEPQTTKTFDSNLDSDWTNFDKNFFLIFQYFHFLKSRARFNWINICVILVSKMIFWFGKFWKDLNWNICFFKSLLWFGVNGFKLEADYHY